MLEILPNQHIIIFLFILFNCSNNYIVIPFNSKNLEMNLNDNSVNEVENFLSEINKIELLYSLIQLGAPLKNLELYFTMEKTIYTILSNFCPEGTFSSYSPYFSQTYKNLSKSSFSFDTIIDGLLASDDCLFYSDLNLTENKIINSFEFILGNNSSPGYQKLEPDKFCGCLGLVKNPNEHYIFAENFINYLKGKKIINSYEWGIFFFDKEKSYNINNDIYNKYDGFYIAGITEDDYLNIFKTSNIIGIHSPKTNNYITIDKIYFYDSPMNRTEYLVSNDTIVEIVLDNNYIISDIEYYQQIKEYFFKKYFDNNICYENSTIRKYGGKNYMIICDLSIKENLKNFPTLYLLNRDFSFTFNLNYNDVFFESDNKIFFLIIGKDLADKTWMLGKNFMKKYLFIFDQDCKSIKFIHLDKYGDQKDEGRKEQETEKNKSNFWKNFKIFLLIFLLIIAIIIGIFIGKQIWKKNRKIRCNELKDEENYDYISKEEGFTKIVE